MQSPWDMHSIPDHIIKKTGTTSFSLSYEEDLYIYYIENSI